MKYDYDIVVIGGGAAGLVAATGAAGLGAKTAMIEKNRLGGDCTWNGCIPSKALLKSAQVCSLIRRAEEFGLSTSITPEVMGVMEHVRAVVRKVSTHHPPEVFEKRGIKVIFGEPKFIDNRSIAVGNTVVRAKRFIICTGSRPFIPPIDGLRDGAYLTNENVFDLKVLPRSLIVLGGGPIGAELSQAFCRLGVEVSIVEMLDRLLFREDPEISDILADRLKSEGVKVYAGQKAVKVLKDSKGITLTLEDKGRQRVDISGEQILVAVGRQANVNGLDLEKAKVNYSNKGIAVDANLRTSAANIYACGDAAGPYQFSHTAEYQAIIAVGNALFPFKRKADYNSVPWCTFTDPEVAHLGLTEEEARQKLGGDIRVYRNAYSTNDRAVTDIEEIGLVKVICDKRGAILGAHICGASAGEIIHEYVLAKSSGLKIGAVSSAIHIYPTISQSAKHAADNYYFDLMKSGWFRWLAGLLLKFLR